MVILMFSRYVSNFIPNYRTYAQSRLQANKSDGWDTDPFTLTINKETGQLIGRGSTDDKGPILGWLNVLQYHHEKNIPLPVNLICCFEGMEESGSEGLDDLVRRESLKGGYFDGVECVCIVSLFLFLMVHLYCLTLRISLITTGSTPAPQFSHTVYVVSPTTKSLFPDLAEISTQALLDGLYMNP